MVKCVFCGREEQSFKGVHLIKNDGSINYFCSGKCRKNAINLKRDKKKLKWTNFYRTIREEEKQKTALKMELEKARAEKADTGPSKKEKTKNA